MAKKILIGVAVVVVVFLLVVVTRPDSYKIERSTAIAAPAAAVFAYTNDLHKWDAWSPWAKKDPAMKTEHGGPANGVGSTYHWAGNKEVGEGNMTIQESVPNEKVGMKLEFIKPFASVCTITLTSHEEGGATKMTWAIEGKHNFMSKAMGVFMSMDKMLGPDFEKGLANLKTAAEEDAKKAAAAAPAAEPVTATGVRKGNMGQASK